MQSTKDMRLHVAIIMDGNGRWANRRGLPRGAGHRAGVAALLRVVERADELGVARLTVYAFSSDNWRRPAAEVECIFWLLRAFLRLETERLRLRGAGGGDPRAHYLHTVLERGAGVPIACSASWIAVVPMPLAPP